MTRRYLDRSQVIPFLQMTSRAALGTFAVATIVAVVAVIAGLGTGYRPVIITTGSMTPTAPAGSLVVAQPVERVHPGDILIMRRDGRATVTHRVLEIEFNASGDRYAITRGDANSEIDAAPYAIGPEELTGRWIVPGFGRLLLAMGSPIVAISVITLAVAVIAFGVLRRIWQPTDPAPRPAPTPSSGRRGRRRRLRLAAAATVLGVTLAGGGVAWSLYLGVASVGSNVFATAECFDARLAGVQKGQLSSTTEGTETVTISAVDPSRSFLQFSVRSSAGEPADAQVMGSLANATTVEFHRRTDAASPPSVEIEWSVVEYVCGVSVQRGVVSGGGTSQVDIPIATVDAGSSFVLVSSAPDRTDAAFDGDDLQIAELVGGDTVRIRSAGAPLGAGRSMAWQVVTFTDPADARAQTLTVTLGPGTGSVPLALGSPVDRRTTFVLATVASPSTGTEIGERTVRVRLLDSATVEVARSLTSESVEVHVQVVELTDGTTVRRGVLDLDPGELSASVTIPAVDPARTTVSSTVALPGSLSGGATDDASGVIGEASATARLVNPATISIERQAASASASFAWQAVSWGGPAWADPLLPFRQRIDVTAGGVDAPGGYTTPLTLDHAALVDAGLALADGRDLRVWRFDGTTWTELDRVLDESSSWNQPSTTLWFRTQESIAAGERVSYWLYFGNDTPPPVLDDPDNVWLLREGFEDGTLGAFEDRTAGTSWYRALAWTRRQQLTIDAANVASALTDQPVLVRLTDPDLTSAQADGSDFRFTAGDGVTPLPHEIESWDPATNTLTAWVRVPFVSAGTDTNLYLYYGAGDAPDQQSIRQVWVDDLAAWNLARDPAGPAPTLDDSSTGNHDGLALADTGWTATPSGPAAVLDGVTDRLEAAPFDVPGSAFTVAAWFRADGFGTDPAIVAQGDPNAAGVFELGIDTTTVPGSPTARFVLRVDGTPIEASGGAINVGTWHHVAASWDGADITLFVDGTAVDTVSASGLTLNGSLIPIVLGGSPDGTRTLQGLLGQVRMGASAWTPARVAFAEANLRNPSDSVTASGAVGGTWFGQGDWTIRRPLSIASDQVAGPVTDFPLLVQMVDADLAATAQPDGDDLVFVAADGVTRLDYHIERWDGATGALTAWVRIPVLDPAEDTRFFLYLGNPAAVDQTDPVAVFGSDADLVTNG